ncbi:MAG: dTMP kinase [Verrucomicrobiota bacterium]
MERGLFITFEGSEGCGKSTQIDVLGRRLGVAGHEFLVTREPGGTAVGETIRELLQYREEGEGMTAESEVLLFAASRAQLVREVVAPAVAAGKVVIADRFMDSTTVYQGVARRLGGEAVGMINGFAVGDCVPDVTFLLDMDSETAHARATAASGEAGRKDRMESQPLSFYEDVRAGYLELAKAEGGRICVLDATRKVDEIGAEIWGILKERFDGVFG